MENIYFNKYLKYKSKYLLYKQYGGLSKEEHATIKSFLQQKYISLVKILGDKIDIFIQNYIGQNNTCINNILNKKLCNFLKFLNILYDNGFFTGYDEDITKLLSGYEFLFRLSLNAVNIYENYKYPLVFYYNFNNEINKQLLKIDYDNDQIIYFDNTHTYNKIFPFKNFIFEFGTFFHTTILRVNLNYLKGDDLRKVLIEKIQNYQDIDRVLILTFQFQYENGKSFLPGENENNKLTLEQIVAKYKNEPGLTSLLIANEYKNRLNNKDIPINIVLNNDPNKQTKINNLTTRSRLIIIGHCCKLIDGQYKINGVSAKDNREMGPYDLLELLNNNNKLKQDSTIYNFIISIYACEAADKFCKPLSNILFENNIKAILKCRSEPVTRLSTQEISKVKQIYQVESCHKPKVMYNNQVFDYAIENDI